MTAQQDVEWLHGLAYVGCEVQQVGMWTAMEDFAIPCSQELRAIHVPVYAPVYRRDPLGRFVHHLVRQMGYCPSPGAPSRSPETRTHLTEQTAQVRARWTLLPASRTQLCLRRPA